MDEGDNTVVAYMKFFGWSEDITASYHPHTLIKMLDDAVQGDLQLRELQGKGKVTCDMVLLQSVRPMFRIVVVTSKLRVALTGYSIRHLLSEKNLAQLYLMLRTT